MADFPAYIVHFETSTEKGQTRFGGRRARDNANTFAIAKLEEILNEKSTHKGSSAVGFGKDLDAKLDKTRSVGYT